MKIKSRSRNKRNGVGHRRIRTCPFSFDSAYDSVASFHLWSSDQIVGVESRSGRINQSQGTFPRFVIFLILPLLLATSTTSFHLIIYGGVVSGITTLFSLDRKFLRFWLRLRLRLSSENQPLKINIHISTLDLSRMTRKMPLTTLKLTGQDIVLLVSCFLLPTFLLFYVQSVFSYLHS